MPHFPALKNEAKNLLAYRLHAVGWTQVEIGDAIGVSHSGVGERFVSEVPDLETEIKTLLAYRLHAVGWTPEEIGAV